MTNGREIATLALRQEVTRGADVGLDSVSLMCTPSFGTRFALQFPVHWCSS